MIKRDQWHRQYSYILVWNGILIILFYWFMNSFSL